MSGKKGFLTAMFINKYINKHINKIHQSHPCVEVRQGGRSTAKPITALMLTQSPSQHSI